MADDQSIANGDDCASFETAAVGPEPNFEEMGLSTTSHHEPEFKIKENEFIIKFKAVHPVKIFGKVIRLETGEASLEHVFIQTHRNLVNVFVSLPNPGDYKLQIYALPVSDPSQQLPNVFTYLIHCVGMPRKCRFFPRQYAQWRDGCALYEPFSLAGERVQGDVPFRVRIPEALAAAVTVQDEWTHLEPADDGIWQGTIIDIDRFKGRSLFAVLNANFDPDDESRYSSLLAYRL